MLFNFTAIHKLEIIKLIFNFYFMSVPTILEYVPNGAVKIIKQRNQIEDITLGTLKIGMGFGTNTD